jgi:polyhydroxyalkanoate synthesis regulator phasin
MTDSHCKPALAASYARKSTHDDMGLKGQHLVNAQKAQADGFAVPEDTAFRFEDDDTSGRKTSRDNLDRMIALITSNKAPFSRIYVKDKTREGRFADPRFHFFLQVLFERHGVKLCYSDREVQLDFSTGDPRDMFGLLIRDLLEGITSSEELARLIKRITEGCRIWVQRGFYPGNRAPYGLVRWYADEVTGELLEQVVEGAVVKQKGRRFKLRYSEDGSRDTVVRIFDGLEQGTSLAKMSARLNEAGIVAAGGGKWYPEAVRRIASNPIYAGTLIWGRSTGEGDPVPAELAQVAGREPIAFPGFVSDPPISREQFERVQRVLKGNIAAHTQRRRSSPAYPLSSLIVCGACSGTWHGFTSTRAYPSRRRYYRHGRSPKAYIGQCPNQNRYLRAEDLEEPIGQLTTHLLKDGKLADATKDALDQLIRDSRSANHQVQAEEIRIQLEGEGRKLDRLVEDRAGAKSDEERAACQRSIDRTNRRVTDLKEKLAVHSNALERAAKLKNDVEQATQRSSELLALISASAPADLRAVYLELFPRLVVGEGAETITVEIHPLE